MREREFVVLNAVDPLSCLFASTSILHAAAPGGSRYSPELPPPSGRIRALSAFAIEVEPIALRQCRVRCINYADLAGLAPAAVLNLVNTRFFLQALFNRMEKLAGASAEA